MRLVSKVAGGVRSSLRAASRRSMSNKSGKDSSTKKVNVGAAAVGKTRADPKVADKAMQTKAARESASGGGGSGAMSVVAVGAVIGAGYTAYKLTADPSFATSLRSMGLGSVVEEIGKVIPLANKNHCIASSLSSSSHMAQQREIGSWKLGDLNTVKALSDVPGSRTVDNNGLCHVPALSAPPSVMRANLPKPGGGRILVVGDIHGCFDEFLALLEQENVDIDKDTVISIGDMVNKGPKSVDLLRYVMANDHVEAIRGNHEDGALNARYLYDNPSLVSEENKIKPGFEWVQELTEEEIEFLRQLPLSMELPQFDIVLVHAGLLPDLELAAQPHVVQTKIRVFVKDESTGHPDLWIPYESNWKTRKPKKVKWQEMCPWWELWQNKAHVLFGHDARKGLQLGKWATGLDTGCCGKDADARLTAIVLGPEIPDATFLQQRRAEGCRQDDPKDRPGTLVSVPKGSSPSTSYMQNALESFTT